MKIIVTHMNPDLDALTSVWLIKRFGPNGWQDAQVKFIPAGSTYKGQKVDSDPDILHVDVGLGKFDHHQSSDKNLCGAKLVLDWLVRDSKQFKENEALLRLVEVVRDIDWAGFLKYPDAQKDHYSFLFFEHGIIGGWQKKFRNQPDKHLEWGLIVLDGIYENLKSKIEAEEILKKGAIKFKTSWGQGIGANTGVFGFVTVAQARGFPIVVSKHPKTGHVRIHAFRIDGKIDLSGVWEILKHRDPQATWFLHSSKKMILNGSKTNPNMIPTKLTLEEVIEVLKKILN